MSDFPTKQLIEDLQQEGAWGFQTGHLKRLAKWIIEAREKINHLNEEISLLMDAQKKIDEGNQRKKKELRWQRAVLRADNRRLAEIITKHAARTGDARLDEALMTINEVSLQNSNLARRLAEKEHAFTHSRKQIKLWRGAAEALFSAFWYANNKEQDASEACKWLIEEARKADDEL